MKFGEGSAATGEEQKGAMSLVRMRSDIKPVCDKHHEPMSLVFLVWEVGGDVSTKNVFACSRLGCQRHYDIIHGYYTIAEGQIERETKTHNPCSKDELPMYLYDYEPQGSVGKWKCAQFGCGVATETRGPIS